MFEWDSRKAAVNHTKHGAATGRVLIVAYTVRRRDGGESIRIISGRRASRKERAAYAAASRD